MSSVQTLPRRISLVGGPNSGKTTLFNALTGLRAKTGNYPGVTVSRTVGNVATGGGTSVIEDLPGTYSLDAISPDEVIVTDVLHTGADESNLERPEGVVLMMDATNLRRGLTLFAQVANIELPMVVALSFSDDLARRQGGIDVEALADALGVRVFAVTQGNRQEVDAFARALGEADAWETPEIAPPIEPSAQASWVGSTLAAAKYGEPQVDSRTSAVDSVLLHPVLGTAIFAAVMFAFFQIIFVVAAPIQDWAEGLMVSAGEWASSSIDNRFLASFVSDAIFGGLGGVVVFLPQIALLFLLISIMEGTGYMARAAFLMDRVMSYAGLEGRAFVSLLSSHACAIPGIMATRSLPSAQDRLATMMAAPLMTCSARLPVYILLIAMLVDSDAKIGPFGAQGSIMFGLYLLGGLSAMIAAYVFKKLTTSKSRALPFYMEMPAYQIPSLRTVGIMVYDACKAFLRKVGGIILGTTIVLWVLLTFPVATVGELQDAGIDQADTAAVTAYEMDHSYAAGVGRTMEPVFDPLGFDWRINVGVVSSLAAREVFVATLGQVAAAADPEDPSDALAEMTVVEDGVERPLFDAPTIAALLVFFVYALQCMSTVGVIKRETGGWKWPMIAFTYMLVLAWVLAWVARMITLALV